MTSTTFSNILKDFKAIFDQCTEATRNPSPENFQNIANAVNSVLSSWIFYLTKSASQSTHGHIDFTKADCSPDMNQQKFKLIIPTNIGAVEELRKMENSYLLTSLILTSLSDDKSEQDLYKMFKQVVEEKLTNKIQTLNNLKDAGVVLLTLNSLASSHYNNLLKKFYKIAMDKAETMGQTDRELAQSFMKSNAFSQRGGKKY